MGQPYYGEIRLFAGNFAPAGWALCEGQLMPIGEFDVLFQIIGTTYGGDGQTTFALPDLRGRVPIHQGAGPGLSPRTMAESGGAETVTVTPNTLPPHTHSLVATSAPATAAAGPGGGVLAATVINVYGTGAPTQAMAAQAVSAVGGGQPHENMAPFSALNYIIALFGVFPPRG